MKVPYRYISMIPTVEDTIRIRELDHSSKLSPEDAIKVLNRYILVHRYPGIKMPLDNNLMSAIDKKPLYQLRIVENPFVDLDINDLIKKDDHPSIWMKRVDFKYQIQDNVPGNISHYHQFEIYHWNGNTLVDLRKEFPHLIINDMKKGITIIPGFNHNEAK